MRVLGIGPAGSLVAAGVLHDREPILVADFGSPAGRHDPRRGRDARRSAPISASRAW